MPLNENNLKKSSHHYNYSWNHSFAERTEMSQFNFLMLLILVSTIPVFTSSFQSNLIVTNNRSRSKLPELQLASEFGSEDQVVEALRSLCDFHEGEWEGSAKSFTVLPDVAAGIVQRKTSPDYKVSVKLGLDSNRDYSISETFNWNDKISSRSLSLNECNVDVDSVDASYSADASLPDFPNEISGTDKLTQFAIEHCIAASENRRMRCFLLYGVEKNLQRIVVCEEQRTTTENGALEKQDSGNAANPNQLTARDLLEMQSDVDRLVDKLTGNDQDATSPSISSPTESEESPMEKLGQSMSSTDDGSQPLIGYDTSLLELSSGVWLGDAIIRDIPKVPASPAPRGKGFGSSSSKSSSSSSTGSSDGKRAAWGTWNVGVQKIAWRWMWNFGDEIRQVIDVGKAMGAELVGSVSKSLSGSVCVNESLSRRIPKNERMVYVDWTGDMVGILAGSVSIQVPRYLNFDRAGSKVSAKPFITEFCLYQSASAQEGDDSDGEESINLPELYCSKISRVYNFEGKLKQGISSFYKFQRFGVDDHEGEEL